jgi:hypothetical protein
VHSVGPHDTTVEEMFRDAFSMGPCWDITSERSQLFKTFQVESPSRAVQVEFKVWSRQSVLRWQLKE